MGYELSAFDYELANQLFEEHVRRDLPPHPSFVTLEASTPSMPRLEVVRAGRSSGKRAAARSVEEFRRLVEGRWTDEGSEEPVARRISSRADKERARQKSQDAKRRGSAAVEPKVRSAAAVRNAGGTYCETCGQAGARRPDGRMQHPGRIVLCKGSAT